MLALQDLKRKAAKLFRSGKEEGTSLESFHSAFAREKFPPIVEVIVATPKTLNEDTILHLYIRVDDVENEEDAHFFGRVKATSVQSLGDELSRIARNCKRPQKIHERRVPAQA